MKNKKRIVHYFAVSTKPQVFEIQAKNGDIVLGETKLEKGGKIFVSFEKEKVVDWIIKNY